jgi:ATP-dependent DNA helicase RecG
MGHLVVRYLEDDVKEKLRDRARRHGHSTEEEVCEILRNAVQEEGGEREALGSRLAARFGKAGLTEDISELRGQTVHPVNFESPLSLKDLDLAAFDSYLEETGQSYLRGDDPERLLANWYLATNGHPTVAGLLLFGRKPQQHLPHAQVNAARFAGTDSSYDPTDRKDLGGRLLEVVDQAERFLDLHLPVPHVIHGFEPEPRPELPKEALREAIVNAVAHRDYTIRGPIRLFVFDDRIEIHTPGRPPNGVDAEAMRAGAHVVRNPWIYARLSDAGLVTRAGTGIRRIVRLVREATGREAGVEVRDFEVLLTLPRPQKPA